MYGVVLECGRLHGSERFAEGLIYTFLFFAGETRNSFLPQGELAGRDVSLHNQKLALESVVRELQDTKQTIDRFRYERFVVLCGKARRRLRVGAFSMVFSPRFLYGCDDSVRSPKLTCSHYLCTVV